MSLLKRKIEMVQYNAAIMISSAFKGTSHDKIYQELGLESLAAQGSTRKQIFFTKSFQDYYHLTLRIAYFHVII